MPELPDITIYLEALEKWIVGRVLAGFSTRLYCARRSHRGENHTLERSLTAPHLFSGIGNSYSDEILHAARLSPVMLTTKLSDGEIARLHTATRAVLADWSDRLRKQTGGKFPTKVTAFLPRMAVHGKFGRPCPVCGTAVQRIRYAEKRGELLSALPDRRKIARRSIAVAAVEKRLAADH